jgi:hypothetical protein
MRRFLVTLAIVYVAVNLNDPTNRTQAAQVMGRHFRGSATTGQ